MKPRWYQADLISKTRLAWSKGHQTVILVSPPRSGKTPTAVWLSEPFIEAGQGVVFGAHREELVRQIAMTFAEFGHDHRIMAPKDVIADIIRRQITEYGRSFVNPNALVMVGSVQTINSRSEAIKQFASRVGLWLVDEAHHVLTDNTWGKVISLFPNARGVGFTATPARTDKKSLARAQGGVFDVMVKGVTARQLINEGFICDYSIVAPPASISREAIPEGSKGDYTQKGLSDASRESTITGDCVKTYLEHSADRQAVVFTVDVVEATKMAQAFRDAGVSAEVVSAKTAKTARKHIMDKFERGVFKVLCNVDLFGEGLNVEGIETVIMARPTKSFVLFVQQFFRALTRGDGKNHGLIIDHVGNVGYFRSIYGFPDAYNGWTLIDEERGKKRTIGEKPDEIKVTTCTECFSPYEAVKPACPVCGHEPVPVGRSKPEQVDGDLVLLDPDVLAELRGDADRIFGEPLVPRHLTGLAEAGAIKQWTQRREAQVELRERIALWAGYWRDQGDTDREITRRFFMTFGVDVMTAQTLGKSDANKLSHAVDADLMSMLTSANCEGE